MGRKPRVWLDLHVEPVNDTGSSIHHPNSVSNSNYYLPDNYTHIYTLALALPESRSSYIHIESKIIAARRSRFHPTSPYVIDDET